MTKKALSVTMGHGSKTTPKAPSRRRCLIVMNGRSTRGQADRFCGFTNPPLSEPGRHGVLALRQKLLEAGERLPRIWYVSDRRRAVETFEIMTAGMPTPVVRLSDNLREINFGDYENLTWEELPDDFQRLYEASLTSPMNLKFPGGESFGDLCERVSRGALEILSYEEDDSDLAIVGHQGSMRVWFMMAAGQSPDQFFAATPDLADAQWLEITVAHVAAWRRKFLGPPAGSSAP